ncbi:hypothetical protein VTH82DRAFT_183 [Thermothelomyces myriococcoides]
MLNGGVFWTELSRSTEHDVEVPQATVPRHTPRSPAAAEVSLRWRAISQLEPQQATVVHSHTAAHETWNAANAKAQCILYPSGHYSSPKATRPFLAATLFLADDKTADNSHEQPREQAQKVQQ